MVDAHICKTPEEILNETDVGISIDNIPKEVTDRIIGSSSKKPTFNKVNVKPIDDGMRRVLKPNKKDDPFNRDNWGF
jgi:hypothetical protein